MENLKLNKIAKKYSELNHNENNYLIGGGLSNEAFASRRHQNAKFDEGKLTEGKATQMFIKATGLEIEKVKAIINYATPNKEWHHAGKLPKQYGGGMKKTYFLNSNEIIDLAINWETYLQKLEISIEVSKNAEQLKKELEAKKLDFLSANATKKVRVSTKGMFFYETNREMDGKYGWFCSYGKLYNMTEYFTGWEFESEEKYNEFFNIK